MDYLPNQAEFEKAWKLACRSISTDKYKSKKKENNKNKNEKTTQDEEQN